MEVGASFLQSPEWEKFQQSLGRQTYWLDGVLYIKHPLRFGQDYWYAPRAATVPAVERLDAVFAKHTSFVLLEPTTGLAPTPFFPTVGRQPRQTLLLDLKQPLEKISAKMKSKTRYNIHLAERKGVQTFIFSYPDCLTYLPVFMQLTQETNLRNQIRSHPDQYYQKLLETLGPTGKATLHVAYLNDKPMAALILIRAFGTATYLFGASGGEDRSVMGAYLLQWKAIQYAKAQGDAVYDWDGVRVDAEMASGGFDDDANRSQVIPAPGPTFGVTRFKLGFGGKIHFYPPSVVRSYKQLWYTLYSTFRHKGGGFSY